MPIADKADEVKRLVSRLNAAMAELSLDADAQNVKIDLEVLHNQPLGRRYPHPVIHVEISAIHKL